MSVIRWAPVPAPTLQSEVNRLFGTLFDSQAGQPAARRWVPAVDVVETEDELILSADLPGVDGDAVNVEVEDGVLTISGERSGEKRTEGGAYRRLERFSGSFRRSLRLPEGVEAERVHATYRNGVLEIHVPKPQQPTPHRVAIDVAQPETGSGPEPAVVEAAPAA